MAGQCERPLLEGLLQSCPGDERSSDADGSSQRASGYRQRAHEDGAVWGDAVQSGWSTGRSGQDRDHIDAGAGVSGMRWGRIGCFAHAIGGPWQS